MGEHNRTLATDIQLKANTTHITPLQLHNKAKHKHKEENMNSMISTVSRKTCIARKANSRRVAMRAVRNGSRVCMMQTYGFMKKFECLSYLPPLSDEDVAKQIQYLLNQGWSPCIEFAAPEASEADQNSSWDQDTMTTDTTQCGNCLCLDAPTHKLYLTKLLSAERTTQMP